MTSPARSALSVSEDGYVRLTVEAFAALPLVHLITCLDEHDGTPLATPAITGYTEWVTVGMPAITLGWDWQLLPGQPYPVRVNDPRTNLMLVDDSSGNDLSQSIIATFLNTHVDNMPWQKEAMASLRGGGADV